MPGSITRTKDIFNTLLLANDEDLKNPNKMAHKFSSAYIELQYHGDLIINDVDSVCFTEDILDNSIIDKLKDSGVKVYHVEKSILVEL